MANKAFAIVHFDMDNSVEVVPTHWIRNDGSACYFPDVNVKEKQVNKLVKNSSEAHPAWKLYSCSVMKYYDSYTDARDYLNDAMYTSDLSACEKATPKRKKRKTTGALQLPDHPSTLSVIDKVHASEESESHGKGQPALVLVTNQPEDCSRGQGQDQLSQSYMHLAEQTGGNEHNVLSTPSAGLNDAVRSFAQPTQSSKLRKLDNCDIMYQKSGRPTTLQTANPALNQQSEFLNLEQSKSREFCFAENTGDQASDQSLHSFSRNDHMCHNQGSSAAEIRNSEVPNGQRFLNQSCYYTGLSEHVEDIRQTSRSSVNPVRSTYPSQQSTYVGRTFQPMMSSNYFSPENHNRIPHPTRHNVPESVLHQTSFFGNNVEFPPSIGQVSDCCLDFQKDVLTKLQALEDGRKEQMEMLNAILRQVSTKPKTDSETSFEFCPDQFPIRDFESLDSLLQILRDSKEAYNELVRKLTLCGGGSIDDALKLIFKMMFTDEMLGSHCFKGQSKKRAFIGYAPILDAIVDSMRKNSRLGLREDVTQDAINQGVPKVLKKAADRLSIKLKSEKSKVEHRHAGDALDEDNN